MSGKVFFDAGALASELSLEQCVPVPDGLGGHAEDWVEIGTLFGKIEPVSARSVFGAAQTIETVTHRIILRHRDDVIAGMRFTFAGRVLEIVTVHDPDETGRYLLAGAREVTV